MSSDKLVDGDWLEAHLDDPRLRVFELNSAATDSYDAAHIPGAQGWQWKDWCWDAEMRDFPTPEEFARRCRRTRRTVVHHGRERERERGGDARGTEG